MVTRYFCQATSKSSAAWTANNAIITSTGTNANLPISLKKKDLHNKNVVFSIFPLLSLSTYSVSILSHLLSLLARCICHTYLHNNFTPPHHACSPETWQQQLSGAAALPQATWNKLPPAMALLPPQIRNVLHNLLQFLNIFMSCPSTV